MKSTFLIVLFFIGLLLFVVLALSIPVVYETMTLWYKTGNDRVMLKSGQFIGLITFVMIYLQVIMSTRGRFLDDLFGVPNLLKWHRVNGLLIVLFGTSHVFLVLAPEGLTNLPIGKKFWPEMIGAVLYLFIVVTATSSFIQKKLRLSYVKWRSLHKPLGYCIVFLVTIHLLFVSESFEQRWPRIFLAIAFSGLALWVSTVKWLKFRMKHKSKT